MPNVKKGKKVFNTSLHTNTIAKLEWVCNTLGLQRTKVVETAILKYLTELEPMANSANEVGVKPD